MSQPTPYRPPAVESRHDMRAHLGTGGDPKTSVDAGPLFEQPPQR